MLLCFVQRYDSREALPDDLLPGSCVSAGRGRGIRVLFLLTEIFANGGIQRFNKTLLAAADECGVTCRVLTLNDPAADRGLALPECNGEGIRWRSQALRPGHGPRALARRLRLRAGRTCQSSWHLVAGALLLRPSSAGAVILVAHGIEVWSGIRPSETVLAGANATNPLRQPIHPATPPRPGAGPRSRALDGISERLVRDLAGRRRARSRRVLCPTASSSR